MATEAVSPEDREVLSRIAHELASPVMAARGNLELAARRLEDGRFDEVRPFLEEARQALDRLSRLTNYLLAAARGTPPDLEMVPIDLREPVGQVCAWTRPEADAKGVSLIYRRRRQPLMVRGNHDALLSIFGNILSNAVRYTPAGGRIQVGFGVREGWAELSVTDTGVGMARDVQARAFDTFYRSPLARELQPQGLGLGLSLVKQLVDAHGGRLELSSDPGRGTTVSVLLPLAGTPENPREMATDQERTRGP